MCGFAHPVGLAHPPFVRPVCWPVCVDARFTPGPRPATEGRRGAGHTPVDGTAHTGQPAPARTAHHRHAYDNQYSRRKYGIPRRLSGFQHQTRPATDPNA